MSSRAQDKTYRGPGAKLVVYKPITREIAEGGALLDRVAAAFMESARHEADALCQAAGVEADAKFIGSHVRRRPGGPILVFHFKRPRKRAPIQFTPSL